MPHLFLFQLVSKHLFLSMQKAQDQTTKPISSSLVTYWHLPISCRVSKRRNKGRAGRRICLAKLKKAGLSEIIMKYIDCSKFLQGYEVGRKKNGKTKTEVRKPFMWAIRKMWRTYGPSMGGRGGKGGREGGERVVTKGLKEIMSKQELLFNSSHVSSDFSFQSTILHSHICCLILSLEKHFEGSCGVKEPPNSTEVTASLLFRAQSYIRITHALCPFIFFPLTMNTSILTKMEEKNDKLKWLSFSGAA